MRRTTFMAVTLTLLAATSAVQAQGTLAARVARAPNGVVRVQFDGRPGVCGNGRDVVGYRNALFARNFQSIGRWNDARCIPGPLRVTLAVTNGQVTRLETQVGGAWLAPEATVTDLGVVAPRDASPFFFALVPRLESASGKDRLLLPAVLADDAPVIAPLLALARDDSRLAQTRRQAVQWLGLLGDASVVPALVALAKESVDDDGENRGKKGLSSAATAALSTLDGNVGMPALIDLARSGSVGTRRNAVFWLGQNGDPRAMRVLHSVIEDTKEDNRVRAHAIFALSHGGDTPTSEFNYLRSVYSQLDDDKLKEAVFQGMGEDAGAGGRWLIERARDTREPTRLRKNALFWAGQRGETPIDELVSVYRDADDSGLKEHAIFVLSQRRDEPATGALIRIAREDKDTRMRGKALFWLAQMKDPRVSKLISDLILK